MLFAFLRRDWGIASSYRLTYVLELAGQILQLALFFYLGRLVDRAGLEAEGLDQGFFAFVVVGMLLVNLGATALTSFSTSLRTEQITGSLEALLATPAPWSLLILSSAAYEFIRATIAAVAMVTIAVLFFGLEFNTGWLSGMVAILALLASVVLFAAVGVGVAAFTMVFKRAGAVLGLVTTAIGLLSGVYFPVGTLPLPLRLIARAMPFTWGLDVLRGALLEDRADVERLVLLLVAAIAAIPVALWIFAKSLQRARLDGTLAQY